MKRIALLGLVALLAGCPAPADPPMTVQVVYPDPPPAHYPPIESAMPAAQSGSHTKEIHTETRVIEKERVVVVTPPPRPSRAPSATPVPTAVPSSSPSVRPPVSPVPSSGPTAKPSRKPHGKPSDHPGRGKGLVGFNGNPVFPRK